MARTPDGKFLKGSSGNPGGRPEAVAEIRELARQHGPAAIERLRILMYSVDGPVAVAACRAMLDRGFGKPAQPLLTNGSSLVNITMQTGGTIITAEDAAAVYRELCGDPSLDISHLKLAAPAPAQAVERQSLPAASDDPLAPATEKADRLAMWERLSK